MDELIKTEDDRYSRDPHSKALVLTDKKQLDEYQVKKNEINKRKQMEERLNTLETKVDQIIDILLEKQGK